jgi:hypothetical protein
MTPTLREVLDAGGDPTEHVPQELLLEVMIQAGETLVAGGKAIEAVVAEALDIAAELVDSTAVESVQEVTAALWVVELVEDHTLMPRLVHCNDTVRDAFIIELRAHLGIGGAP